jgi:hypothetical protein
MSLPTLSAAARLSTRSSTRAALCACGPHVSRRTLMRVAAVWTTSRRPTRARPPCTPPSPPAPPSPRSRTPPAHTYTHMTVPARACVHRHPLLRSILCLALCATNGGHGRCWHRLKLNDISPGILRAIQVEVDKYKLPERQALGIRAAHMCAPTLWLTRWCAAKEKREAQRKKLKL